MTIQSSPPHMRHEQVKPPIARVKYEDLIIGATNSEGNIVDKLGMKPINPGSTGSTEFAGGLEAIVEFASTVAFIKYFPNKSSKERFELRLTQEDGRAIMPDEAYAGLKKDADGSIAILDRSQVGPTLRAISKMQINRHTRAPSPRGNSMVEVAANGLSGGAGHMKF
jgi:hypothetical protein